MSPIRVVVADDHPVYREGLALLLSTAPEIEVVGQATTGREAVALVTSTAAHVVVLDLRMPDLDGIEATRAVLAADPDVGVVILTMYEDDESVFAAMRAGARGYLLKGANREEILRAITVVAQGEAIFGPSLARRVAAFFSGAARPAGTPFPELTTREREVLDLIAAGRSNAAIAHLLVLSPKTVRNHITNIFTKLQVADRSQAIVRAREAGLGGGAPA